MNVNDIALCDDWMLIDIEDKGFGMTSSGLFIPDDDFIERGIRPRWAYVAAVGPDCSKHGIQAGTYVLVDHGDWTRKLGKMTDAAGKERAIWGTKAEKVVLHAESKPDFVGRKAPAPDLERLRMGV